MGFSAKKSAIMPSNQMHNIKKFQGANFEINPKTSIFGPFWDRLAQNLENRIFLGKSGSVTFLALLCPDLMYEIKKILGTVTEISLLRTTD
jgi:hypothetical protein